MPVVDAVLLELADGPVEVHRAGSDMTCRVREAMDHLLDRQLAGIATAAWAGIEHQRAYRPGFRADGDPAGCGDVLQVTDLAMHQAAQLVMVIVVRQAVDD